MKHAVPYVILLTCGCSLDAVSGTREAPRDGSMENAWDSSGASPEGGDPTGDGGTGDASSPPSDAASPPPMPGPDASEPDASDPPPPMPDAGEQDAGPTSFTPPPGDVGAPCEQASDCNGIGNACLTSLDGDQGTVEIPNGYCTRTCNLIPCGENERCVEGNVCVRTCERDSDCRADEGYECRDDACTVPGL